MGKIKLKGIIDLAVSKKSSKEKLAYLLKGFLYFIPIIISNLNEAKGENDDELQGDDIYPLF